jgi:nucleoside-diphosphate-sugar epimerase
MRIFVTGALGFIGSHFVMRALAAGHEVLGLYRRADGEKAHRLRQLATQGAHLTHGDILEPDRFDALLEGVNCICHFAAAFKGSGHRAAEFERINVTGTRCLLQSASRAGVQRFVLCSTAGIYGQQLKGVTDETAEPRPWNGYERSKHAAEVLVRTHAARHEMQYVILRPAVVYGPGDDRLLKLFRSASKGRFPLFGPGEGRRHMVYVTDVVDAFLLACTTRAAANQEMIIAGPQAVRLRDLLDVLAGVVQRRRCGPRLPLLPMLLLAAAVEDACKLVGVSPPLYRRRMDFYRSDAEFDCSRARQILGWSPRIDLVEGLRHTYEASRAEKCLVTRIASLLFGGFTLVFDAPATWLILAI